MTNLYLFIAVTLAYLVKGLTGFGNTLVMAPMFSAVVAPKTTTPVDLLFSLPANAFLVWKERAGLKAKVVIPLASCVLIGNIPGVLFLKNGNVSMLKMVLGLVVLFIGLEMLFRDKFPVSKTVNPVTLTILGVLSGFLAGMFGIGAPMVAYINRVADNNIEFRANICCVFLIENIFRLFAYGYTGILTRSVVIMALLLGPAVIIGMKAGFKMYSHLDAKVIHYFVIVLLLVSGSLLSIRSLLAIV